LDSVPVYHHCILKVVEEYMARYKLAVSLSCSVFLLMLGVGVTVALLPRRVIALSGSFVDVGCLASAFAFPFVLLQIPIGRLADRYGFGAFLTAGYMFCCLSGLTYCFAETPTSIFVGRILQGIGEAPIWALAPALLSIQYSEGKGKAMGMYNTSIHLGLTAGSLLGLLTFDVWNGDEAFWVLTATSMCGGLLIPRFIGSPHRGTSEMAKRAEKRNLVSLMSSREFCAILAGITLYGCGYGMFLTVIPMLMISSASSGGDVSWTILCSVLCCLEHVAVPGRPFIG
jgi:MFS family permease